LDCFYIKNERLFIFELYINKTMPKHGSKKGVKGKDNNAKMAASNSSTDNGHIPNLHLNELNSVNNRCKQQWTLCDERNRTISTFAVRRCKLLLTSDVEPKLAATGTYAKPSNTG
jgi:hypothetical protein